MKWYLSIISKFWNSVLEMPSKIKFAFSERSGVLLVRHFLLLGVWFQPWPGRETTHRRDLRRRRDQHLPMRLKPLDRKPDYCASAIVKYSFCAASLYFTSCASARDSKSSISVSSVTVFVSNLRLPANCPMNFLAAPPCKTWSYVSSTVISHTQIACCCPILKTQANPWRIVFAFLFIFLDSSRLICKSCLTHD